MLAAWQPAALIANQAPAPIEDSLPELAAILDSAENQAPDLAQEALLQREAAKRLKQAKAAYHPKLDLITNFGYRKDFRQDNEDTDHMGLTYTAQLRRPIYHWGAVEAGVEQARIQNANEKLDYQNRQRAIHYQIRADYLTLILDQLALKNEIRRKELLEAGSQDDAINFEAGKLSQLAYQEKALNLQASLLRIEQIKQSQLRITERFKLYAGWEADVDPETSEIPKLSLEDLQAWLRQQLEYIASSRSWLFDNYALKKRDNDIRHHQEAITQIKAQQRPLVSASASASQNQSNTSTQNNVDTVSLFAGIRVQWNIFDGFLTRNRLAEARLKLRRMELESQQKSEQIKLQALELLDQLLFSTQNLALEEARFELEKVKFTSTQSEAESGRKSKRAFENKQLQFDQRFLALQRQRANLHLALQNYQNLVTPIEASLP